MTGPERGFALLCSHLGNPQRRPLTVAQLRKLYRRVQASGRPAEDRELALRDLTALGYGTAEGIRILELLNEDELLARYLRRGTDACCRLLTPVTPGYPYRLWEALGEDAPGCLWAKGNLEILNRPAIALVGSRDLSPENAKFARKVGEMAAKQGYAIVSGNARGADRTAQNACLAAGGQVISIVADTLTDKAETPNILWLSEEGFDLEFSAQRAISRNRCIHALGQAAIAAQCSLKTGGTWDGSVKNLRAGWSPLCVFDDGTEAAALLTEMGASPIGFDHLQDLGNLPKADQLTIL